MVKYRAASAPVFFPLFEGLPSTGVFITVLFFFNYALLITSRAANFLMTLNRFTVMQLSAQMYNKVGKLVYVVSTMIASLKLWKYLLPVSVIAMCIVAAGLNVTILTAGARLIPPTAERNTYNFDPHDAAVEVRYDVLCAIT